MKNTNKFLVKAGLVSLSGVLFLASGFSVFAQDIGIDLPASDAIGSIATVPNAIGFIFNLLKYFGWAGVIIGVGLAIFGLIYKLINTDNQKVMETVQGYITKAVVIVIAGILLISAGFIVRVVGDIFGVPVNFDLQTGTSDGSNNNNRTRDRFLN